MSSKSSESTKEKEENSFLYKLCILLDPQRSIIAVGPKIMQLNYIVNAQKFGTLFVMFFLMYYYNNYSLGAWIYLSLHGTYGFIWITKDMIFPDKSFQSKVTFPAIIGTGIFLFLYWVIGWLRISDLTLPDPSPRRIFSCFFTFTIGLFLMVCTDLQKYITLSFRKGLIDDYFLAKNRNTNYFGEILVYLSFAMCTGKTIGYIILITIWIVLFGSRIYLKECSLKKKDGYKKYQKNSYLILFKFTQSNFVNFIIYCAIGGFVIICLYY